MSELFDKAHEYARNPDIVMGGRLPREFSDEGQRRLQSQAIRAVSEARMMTRLDGFNEEYHGFQGKTIGNLNKLQALCEDWNRQPDGSYTKTFATSEGLQKTLLFMQHVVKDYEQEYRGPHKKGLTLTMSEQNYNLVFNPTQYVIGKLPEKTRNRLTDLKTGKVELSHVDLGEPTTSAFALAYELTERLYPTDGQVVNMGVVNTEVTDVIRNAAKASDKWREDDASLSRMERGDLADKIIDGKLYGAAHGLLLEALDRVERKNKKHAVADSDATPDMARLVKTELDHLRRNMLDGWKPYKNGCMTKVFNDSDKGKEVFAFLMQMFEVTNFHKPVAMEPGQMARDADVIKSKNEQQETRTRLVVPAAVLKAVQENEQQLGI